MAVFVVTHFSWGLVGVACWLVKRGDGLTALVCTCIGFYIGLEFSRLSRYISIHLLLFSLFLSCFPLFEKVLSLFLIFEKNILPAQYFPPRTFSPTMTILPMIILRLSHGWYHTIEVSSRCTYLYIAPYKTSISGQSYLPSKFLSEISNL